MTVTDSIPFQLTFRNFSSSQSVWMAVQDQVEKLERFYARITNCQVVVSKPHRHNSQGQVFHVEIRLHVPGQTIVVNREPEIDDEHTNIFVAIRDAFDSLERRLEDHMRIRRGYVKHHEVEYAPVIESTL